MPCVYVCVIIGGIYCPLFQKKYLQGFHLSADIPLSFYFGWLAEYVWWTERNRGNLFLEWTVLHCRKSNLIAICTVDEIAKPPDEYKFDVKIP